MITMNTLKASFHGVHTTISYSQLPIGVSETSVNAAIMALASDVYEELGGNGQELSPEVIVNAAFGELYGCVTIKSVVNGREWQMHLVSSNRPASFVAK